MTFRIQGQPKLPILNNPEGRNDIELTVYEDEKWYPKGLYLYTWINKNSRKKDTELSIREIKSMMREVLKKLKEKKKTKLYFHPNNSGIRRIASKLGAIVEKDMAKNLGVQMMSMTIGQIYKATKEK